MQSDALAAGPDGRPRCFWAVGGAPEYVGYHDEEWGRPVLTDDGLFERLTLEAFQSGLSWLTILRKRPAFRAAFAGFDVAAVAAFGDADRERLLADAGIVRNRLKIEAALANARAALPVIEEHGSLAAFFWRFRPEAHEAPRARADWVAASPESKAWPRSSRSAASASSARRPPTRSCRRPASSTTTPQGCCVRGAVEAAAAARRRRASPDGARAAAPPPSPLPASPRHFAARGIPRAAAFLVGLRTRQGAAPGDASLGADRQKEQ